MLTKEQGLAVCGWLTEMDLEGHEILDSDGLAADFKKKTGLDAPWTGIPRKAMEQAIERRGLDGFVNHSSAPLLVSAYEVAEAISGTWCSGGPGRYLFGLGSRCRSAVERFMDEFGHGPEDELASGTDAFVRAVEKSK